MKIATYKGDKFIKYGYPRKDLKPIEGDYDQELRFYYVEENKPAYDTSKEYLKKVQALELTAEKHAEYPHILKAVQNYELVAYSQEQIISKLNDSVGNHIEANLPVWKQVKYLSRFMYLDILKNEGTATDEQLQEMLYLNDLDNWVIKCRADRDEREQELINNNIFPSFEWEAKPEKTF